MKRAIEETVMRNRLLRHRITVTGIAALAFLAIASGASIPRPTANTAGGSEQLVSARQSGSGQAAQPVQAIPAQASSTSPYYTGNGGKGMRLGILVPHSQGLDENQGYLPAMIQGVLVSNMSRYSAISVLDRVSLDRVIMETLDGTYEDDFDVVRIGHIAQVGHILTGNIIRTSTGFSLQLNVTDTTPQANTVASYSGTCTAAELDNHSAIHRASLELLSQLNVTLTARARNELGRASAPEAVNAQAALARGVTAEREGAEVAALSYYLQAASFDPLLLEAEDRLNIASAAFSRGNVGTDARGDIQWRNQWITRLRETEEFVPQFLRQSPAFYLVYSFSDDELAIDFVRETVTMVVEIRSLPEPTWFMAVNQLTSTVKSALLAIGRAETWGLNWPTQSITTPSPFAGSNTTYTVVVEILNANGTSIARQTVNLPFDWFVSQGAEQVGTIIPRVQFAASKVSFPGIDVNIIDNLSIRISSVNSTAVVNAASQLGIRVLPQQEYDRIQSVVDNGLRTDNLRQYGIQFTQNHNRLSNYNGSSSSVVIPYGVSLVDENSGLRNRGLISVRLPSSLIHLNGQIGYIGRLGGALSDNRLTSIIIPDSVTAIGGSVFQNNLLTSVIIPDSVKSIGRVAFYGNNIRSITIGANVDLWNSDGGAFDYSYNSGFQFTYFNNNRKAGTYTSSDGRTWTYSPRQ